MLLTQWLDELRGDMRLAARQLISAPGFTLVTALTLALGIAAMRLASLSRRLIATFLFGVDPLDPLTFASVPVVILVTAIAAAAAPAWHASRIDPSRRFATTGKLGRVVAQDG